MSVQRIDAELQGKAPVFAALGDETRLRLVARLCGGEPLSITQLASGARMTRQAVTKHLHVLEGAGLVRGSRRGRSSFGNWRPAGSRRRGSASSGSARNGIWPWEG